jgi:hypothetical protein
VSVGRLVVDLRRCVVASCRVAERAEHKAVSDGAVLESVRVL